jgi:hypothetical protein
VNLISQLSLTWAASAAARSVTAPEKREAYHAQENKETSGGHELDRITGIYDEGPAWTNSAEIMVWYFVGIGSGRGNHRHHDRYGW